MTVGQLIDQLQALERGDDKILVRVTRGPDAASVKDVIDVRTGTSYPNSNPAVFLVVR